ncbi:MAG: pyrimidine 5'-nucleotidase [Robiginitomaculum sp.]|nr:pyrimidine 5'-nucleotidase [Robiginitomaculum sp.]
MNLAHIDTWVFDLDNTLYRGDDAFFVQIVDKITQYISRYLALQPTEARILQKQYLAEYGTSLSGLMAVNGMDPAEFLDYVHDVDLDLLKPDPRLYSGLYALPGKKYIFTNGSRGHAKNIGEHWGIYKLFDGVFAVEDMDYTPKPKRSAYEKFIKTFDIDPARALMAEDTVQNLKVPKDMGMATLYIAPNGSELPDYVDMQTYDLPAWLQMF